MTTRRQFVSMGAGAFMTAAGGSLWAAGAPSDRVRVAVVGCHAKGRGFHLMKSILKTPGVQISVVCDPDRRAMDDAAGWLTANGHPRPVLEKDFRKVIERADVDAVVSATPDHFHAYVCVATMRAGKHVYIEKPCAYCPAELEVINRVWKETGTVFQQGSQRRSAPGYIDAIAEIKAKKLIGEPRWGKTWYHTRRRPIGRGKVVPVPEWLDWDLWQGPAPRTQFRDNVVHYNWHWFRRWGTGECGNNQVHFVDVARWMLDVDYPEEVTSTGGKFWMPADQDWEWPDTQMVTYKYPGNKLITWEGTCCVNTNPYMGYGTAAMVFGTEGSALFAPAGGVTLYDARGKVRREWLAAGVPKGKEITNTDNRSGAGWVDSTPAHLTDFVNAIRSNRPAAAHSNADIGTKSTYISLVGNVSQLTGETLKICPKTGRLLSGGEAAKLWSREYAKGWEVV